MFGKIVKTEEVTDKELRIIIELYKSFNPRNRNLMLMASNLLYASQQTSKPDKNAG